MSLDSAPERARALADVELIALLLRTGLKGVSVLQLAQQTLDTFGGLQGLINCAGIGVAEKVLNKDAPQKLANC